MRTSTIIAFAPFGVPFIVILMLIVAAYYAPSPPADITSYPPLTSVAELPSTHPYPDRNEWREESDLDAQWEMAKWTQRAVVVAGLGLLLTGAGIWLVAETLVETRKAVVEAQESGKAAMRAAEATEKSLVVGQRPWLSVDAELASVLRRNQQDTHLTVEVHLLNHGASPATDIEIKLDVVNQASMASSHLEEMIADAIAGRERSPTMAVRRITSKRGDKIRVDAVITRASVLATQEYTKTDLIDPSVVGLVTYKNAFAGGIHYDSFIADLAFSPTGSNIYQPFPVEDGMIIYEAIAYPNVKFDVRSTSDRIA